MRVDILTLFPEMFEGVLSASILRIAQEKGILSTRLVNFRDHTRDKHGKVDDRPYGGGPGMVLAAQPIVDAVEAATQEGPAGTAPHVVLLTPQGRPFSQVVAAELAQKPWLILVCGHYEGFDERIREILGPDEISIGDYVLTGGEIPAMAVLDAVARLLPGVLGDPTSTAVESFSRGLLEAPQYTRPETFRGLKVPEVLLSGNHAEIEKWRRQEAEERTRRRRPDLLGRDGPQPPADAR